MTAGAVHQGLAARVPAYEYAHPDDLLDRAAANGEQPLIVALDSVTDPRNLGAVVRSAAGFGAHGVVIPERRAAGMTATAWKTSAGAAARVPVAQAVNLTRQLKAYQDAGCMVIGLAADGDVSLPDLDLADGPLVIVVGSEGKGLSASSPRPATSWCRSRWPTRWSRSTPVSPRRSPSTRSPRRAPGREPHPPHAPPSSWRSGASSSLVVAAWLRAVHPLQRRDRCWPATTPSCTRRSTAGALDMGRSCPTSGPPSDGPVGVELVRWARPTATTTAELAQRYAAIAGHPEAEEARVDGAVAATRPDAALRRRSASAWCRSAVAAGRTAPSRRAASALAPAAAPVAAGARRGAGRSRSGAQPWDGRRGDQEADARSWLPLGTASADGPAAARRPHGWQIQGGLRRPPAPAGCSAACSTPTTAARSSTARRSRPAADTDELHQPGEDETVAVLVSDRHDNIGMDDGGARGRRRGRCHGRAGRRRRHLDRRDLGGVQPRLAGLRLRGVRRAVAIAGNHDNGTLREPATSRDSAGPTSTASRSSRSPTCGSPASTTRARAGSAPGATRPA